MDWLKGMSGGIWGILEALVLLALFAVVVLPLGNYFWTWVTTANNAVGLIALAVGGAALHWAAHKG